MLMHSQRLSQTQPPSLKNLPEKIWSEFSRLSLQRVYVLLLWSVIGIVLGLSLGGCSSLCKNDPPVVVQAPRKPVPMPQLSTVIPQQTYSSSAAADISSWREKLTDTSTTSKP